MFVSSSVLSGGVSRVGDSVLSVGSSGFSVTNSGFAGCSNVSRVGTDVLSFGGVPSHNVGSRSRLEDPWGGIGSLFPGNGCVSSDLRGDILTDQCGVSSHNVSSRSRLQDPCGGVGSLFPGNSCLSSELKGNGTNNVRPLHSGVGDVSSGLEGPSRNGGGFSNTVGGDMAQVGELLRVMATSNLKSLMPKQDIKKFSGDCKEYHLFIRAFDKILVENLTSEGECIHYLSQFTEGRPHDIVESCMH